MPLVPERAYLMIASVGRADRVPDTAVAVRAYVNGRLAAVSRTVITRVRCSSAVIVGLPTGRFLVSASLVSRPEAGFRAAEKTLLAPVVPSGFFPIGTKRTDVFGADKNRDPDCQLSGSTPWSVLGNKERWCNVGVRVSTGNGS